MLSYLTENETKYRKEKTPAAPVPLGWNANLQRSNFVSGEITGNLTGHAVPKLSRTTYYVRNATIGRLFFTGNIRVKWGPSWKHAKKRESNRLSLYNPTAPSELFRESESKKKQPLCIALAAVQTKKPNLLGLSNLRIFDLSFAKCLVALPVKRQPGQKIRVSKEVKPVLQDSLQKQTALSI